MFFQLRYFEGHGETRIDKGSHLIETPSRERAAGYVRSKHQRTGMDVLMQRIHTADDGIAPPGYRFEKAQVWVGTGSDQGWVRQWFKRDTREEHSELDAVTNMIKRAHKEGLLVEVVWQLAQSNHGSVEQKCAHALHEWDC